MGDKVYLIAELSANHAGKLDIALQTLEAMKQAGADAVKLQTYTADTLTISSEKEPFVIRSGSPWDGRTLYDLYQEASTPWDWHKPLQKRAQELGLDFFSTPFDKTATDFLENLNVPIHKIASFEITDIPLIQYVASKGKPMILSTGIASLEEIEEAVDACKTGGCPEITLLHCVSSYPTQYDEVNLATLPDLAKRFGVKVGISDHSMGIEVPLAAVALGAKVIEKHFILDRSIGGPDSSFSLEPQDFAAMAAAVRNVEKAIGTVNYEVAGSKLKNRQFSRSLYVVKDIKNGDTFSEENIRSIRPSGGMAPKRLSEILGKTANTDIERGTPLHESLIKFD